MSKEEATQCLKLRTLDDQVAEQLCELVDGRVFQVTDSLGNKVEKLDLNKITFFIYTLKENIEIKTKGPRPHPHFRALRHVSRSFLAATETLLPLELHSFRVVKDHLKKHLLRHITPSIGLHLAIAEKRTKLSTPGLIILGLSMIIIKNQRTKGGHVEVGFYMCGGSGTGRLHRYRDGLGRIEAARPDLGGLVRVKVGDVMAILYPNGY
jgi:hypothetical protein